MIEHPYFEVPGGTTFVEESTYVDQTGPLASPEIRSFNHGLGEIFAAVIDAGLTITAFEEHRSVPWNPLGAACVETADHPGEFTLREHPERLPMTYTLGARKS